MTHHLLCINRIECTEHQNTLHKLIPFNGTSLHSWSTSWSPWCPSTATCTKTSSMKRNTSSVFGQSSNTEHGYSIRFENHWVVPVVRLNERFARMHTLLLSHTRTHTHFLSDCLSFIPSSLFSRTYTHSNSHARTRSPPFRQIASQNDTHAARWRLILSLPESFRKKFFDVYVLKLFWVLT